MKEKRRGGKFCFKSFLGEEEMYDKNPMGTFLRGNKHLPLSQFYDIFCFFLSPGGWEFHAGCLFFWGESGGMSNGFRI